MPPGTVSQTTLGEKGFQVTVSRTVTDANGKVVHDDSFASRYIPEDAIYLIGKGGKLPAGQTLSGLYPGYTGSTTGINLGTWLAKPAKKKKPAGTTVPPAGGTLPGAGGTATDDGHDHDRHQLRSTRRRPTSRRLPPASSRPAPEDARRPGRSRPRRRRSAPSSRSAPSA